MESGAISDEQITASTEYVGATNKGRLRSQTGAWLAHYINVNSQWLQVDLGNQHTKVTRVGTQGFEYSSSGRWVTRNKLQYSNDGVNFQYYKEQGQNTDKVKLVHVCIKLLLHTYILPETAI